LNEFRLDGRGVCANGDSAQSVLAWLVSSPSFSRLMIVELWLSFLLATYNAAMIPFLAEIMPADVRTPDSLWRTAQQALSEDSRLRIRPR
jgi:hypothetical protein